MRLGMRMSPSDGADGALVPVELRWTDFDGYGHLHTSAQFVVIETARARYLNENLVPDGEVLDWVLVHVALSFVDELRWNEHRDVACRIAVEAVGRTSITLRESILASGRTVSHGSCVVARWNAAARKTESLSVAQRATLEHLIAG